MRKIKFRAWDGEKYNYDGFVIYPNGEIEYPEGGWDLTGHYDKHLIEQYTGLHDKNGKEIYDGDILEYIGASGFEDGTARVVWCDSGPWYIENDATNVYDFLDDVAYACRVIGNIHENPELLI